MDAVRPVDHRIRARVQQRDVPVIGPFHEIRRRTVVAANLEDLGVPFGLPDAMAEDHQSVSNFRSHDSPPPEHAPTDGTPVGANVIRRRGTAFIDRDPELAVRPWRNHRASADSEDMKRVIAVVAVSAMALAACAGEGSASTTSEQADSPFTLQVAPSEYMPIIPGQLFVILATASGGSGSVTMAADIAGDADVTPPTATVDPGDVTEFTVVARPESIGSTVSVALRAERGIVNRAHSMDLEVVEWSDDLEPLATELRERFVTYLAENHPDFGITTETEWTSTITKPQILVVMHYLFFSEQWDGDDVACDRSRTCLIAHVSATTGCHDAHLRSRNPLLPRSDITTGTVGTPGRNRPLT